MSTGPINTTILGLLCFIMYTGGVEDDYHCWCALEERPKAVKIGQSAGRHLAAFLRWILARTCRHELIFSGN